MIPGEIVEQTAPYRVEGGTRDEHSAMTLTAAPTGPQAYRKVYEAVAQSARQARRDVELILLTWHMDTLIYAAQQVVSELIANVVDHPCSISKVQMDLTRTLSGIRMSLTDGCTQMPVRKSAAPTDESGRGLALVDAFGAKWGCELLPDGKRVWVDLHV